MIPPKKNWWRAYKTVLKQNIPFFRYFDLNENVVSIAIATQNHDGHDHIFGVQWQRRHWTMDI